MTRMGDRCTASGTLEQVSTKRWRIIGPGLLVAAAWIGTGGHVATLVATLVAGSLHGYTLLRARLSIRSFFDHIHNPSHQNGVLQRPTESAQPSRVGRASDDGPPGTSAPTS